MATFPSVRPVIWLLLLFIVAACVDPEDLMLRGTLDVIVVDGTITNLAEAQVIRLSRSKSDPLTGRPGNLPITKATVQVIVDSTQLVFAHETTDGSYQLPSDFKGQVGHSYQLKFWLLDGTAYESSAQIMPSVPPVQAVTTQFNTKSLPANQYGGFQLGHDLFIDTQDPADQKNFYRWDWVLYERQYWCKSCTQSVYAVNNILYPYRFEMGAYYVSGNDLFDDCFKPVNTGYSNQPGLNTTLYTYDYQCRTTCWELLYNYSLNLFSDALSNGGLIVHRKVGSIPFYQHAPALVNVRQASLAADAYRFYKLIQDQTQNTGGLADTPPTIAVGNVHNVANQKEAVTGYFTASAVSVIHHWLDRKDTSGLPLGETDPTGPQTEQGGELYFALNLRRVNPEPSPPYTGARSTPFILIYGGSPRSPTAPCTLSDSKTPFKPDGWQD